MITRPTTLILGAGASAPFGFPTGDKLTQQVLNLTKLNDSSGRPYGMQHFAPLDLQEGEILRFHNELLRSGKQSVDAFLEHRSEFVRIGKAAIAAVLIGYENEDALLQPNDKNWYKYLFNQLNTKFDDFDQNKLSVLTFNYDRSLEHYLFTALLNSYGKPVEKCAEKMKSIPIVHLHGDLGELPYFETDSMRPYTPKVSEYTMRVATKRIKIIHEGFDNAPQFEIAKKILSQSEVICFLGFGYHPTNLQRLGWNGSTFPHGKGKNIFCSSVGLTNAECEYISNTYLLHLRGNHLLDYANWDALRFLRETGVLQIR